MRVKLSEGWKVSRDIFFKPLIINNGNRDFAVTWLIFNIQSKRWYS